MDRNSHCQKGSNYTNGDVNYSQQPAWQTTGRNEGFWIDIVETAPQCKDLEKWKFKKCQFSHTVHGNIEENSDESEYWIWCI